MPTAKKVPKRASKNMRLRATRRFDVADHLDAPAMRAAYLEAWLDEAPDDAAGITRALGDIARAAGMTDVAKATG